VLGDTLASSGVCEAAVTAYIKAGQVKKAIDCCITMNEWDIAVELAQEHDYSQAQQILVKHASQLRARKQVSLPPGPLGHAGTRYPRPPGEGSGRGAPRSPARGVPQRPRRRA